MNKHLKAEVSAAFDCNVRNSQFIFKNATYHMKNLTVIQVEQLVKDGCDLFSAKAKTPPTPAKKNEESKASIV